MEAPKCIFNIAFSVYNNIFQNITSCACSLFLSLYVCLSVCCLSLSFSMCVSMCVSLSVCLSVRSPACLPAPAPPTHTFCLLVFLSGRRTVHLFLVSLLLARSDHSPGDRLACYQGTGFDAIPEQDSALKITRHSLKMNSSLRIHTDIPRDLSQMVTRVINQQGWVTCTCCISVIYMRDLLIYSLWCVECGRGCDF